MPLSTAGPCSDIAHDKTDGFQELLVPVRTRRVLVFRSLGYSTLSNFLDFGLNLAEDILRKLTRQQGDPNKYLRP
jgi:hypothetical protein